MIRPYSVKLTNFGSWESLDFPLDDQGLVLITGATGSGKSTIFRAIYWCLFGVTPESHRVNDLCRQGANWCKVVFEFGKQSSRYPDVFLDYTVTRYRNHPQWKNKVHIVGPGIPKVDEDSLREDTDPLLVRLLGITPEVFRKVFYFVQRDTHRFTSMTDTERKTFLEEVSYGVAVQHYEQVARERFRSLKEKIARIDERTLARKETLKDLLEANNEETLRIKEQIKSLKEVYKEHRSSLLDFKRRHEDDIREWYTRSADLQSRINFDEKVRQSLKSMTGVCPVCASEVGLRTRKERYRRLGEEVKSHTEKVRLLERHIGEYETLQDAVSHDEVEQAKLTDRLRALTMRPSMASLPAQLQERSRADEEERLSLDRELHYTDFWVRGFGPRGLRSLLLRRLVRQLATCMSGYLAMIATDLQAEFLLKDSRVVFEARDSRTVATLSGGERQAVDLAVGLGLRSIVESSVESLDCLILDEPFEGLDRVLQLSCQRLLDSIRKRSVFLITHSNFVGRFTKEYLIEKHNGVSHLVLLRGPENGLSSEPRLSRHAQKT